MLISNRSTSTSFSTTH